MDFIQDIQTESRNKELIQVNNKFTFEKMKEVSIFQAQICYALAINYNNSMILAVAESAIKVYINSSNKLKQMQLLQSHFFEVQTLNFFPNKRPFFLSGSVDSTLTIWSKNLMAKPKIIQKLKGHTSTIFCVALFCDHKNLIVSGGDDSKIKFWTTKEQDLFQWFCYQTIIEDTSQILSLSINQEGNQIVSCILNYQIYVLEEEQNSIFWFVKQKIDVDWYCCRICSINNNTFILTTNRTFNMSVYSRQINTSKYLLKEEIELPSSNCNNDELFPSIFIQNKSLLLIKTGQMINIIRFYQTQNQQDMFRLEQSIDLTELQSDNIFGTISDDGKLLIIWDDNSKEIQIYQSLNNY